MAKKQFIRRVSVSETVQYLYSIGVPQSCAINSAILILLACIISTNYKKDLPPIKLSFISESEENFSIENIPELEIVEDQNLDTKLLDQASSKAIAAYVDTATQNNTPIIETDNASLISDLLIDNVNTSEVDEILNISDTHISDVLTLTKISTKSEKTRNFTRNISNRSNQNTLQQTNEGASNNSGVVQNNDLAELNNRLTQYGAKTGDIQISLSWNTIDDIDLHVHLLPFGSQINWMNKFGRCGGMLDIDMNAHPNMVTNRPVENIFWANNRAPRGTYRVGIQNYMPWSRIPQTDVLVVVKVKNEIIFSKTHTIRYGEGVKEVFRFNF